MDSTAIQAITALSAAQLAQEELHRFSGISAVVVPENYKLESLERLKLEPDFFRGSFSTPVLSQFTGYIDQNGTANTGVFIDQATMTANAIIDMGNPESPEWGKHRARVTLDKTPAYADLLRFNDGFLDQQTFIDFAEDWQDNIEFYGDALVDGQIVINTPDFSKTIKTLRKIKTSAKSSLENEVGNFNAARSALESIEITAGGERPPTGFRFSTIPHDGFDSVAFDCRLRAITDDKSVQLKFRIVQLAQHQELIAGQFREKIVEGIKVDELNIFIGTMDYQK